MASVINTNVSSLNAQRNLNASQSALATSLQRLSSGLRINSAKDDAAGLAISDRFTTQIRGLNQAARNANDAISLSQTAEGALSEVTSNLQRIRELAVQSANATNSSSDRAALDLEVQQRLAEIDRIASQTAFNGQKILDGSFGNAAFQVGANVGETITLDLSTSMRPNVIGSLATATSVDLTTVIEDTAVTGSQATAVFDVADIQGNYATVAATPATVTLGAFTAITEDGASAGTANTISYSLTLDDGTNPATVASFTIAEAGALSAANVSTALVSAGFTDTDGSTFAGFTIGLGGEADIADAVTNGMLTFTRADGDNFTISDAVVLNDGATATGGSEAFADVTSVDGVLVSTAANRDLVFTDTDGGTVTVTLDTDLTSANATAIKALIDAQLGGEFTVTEDDTAGTLTLLDDGNLTGSFSATLNGALTPSSTTAGVTDVATSSITLGATDFGITLGSSAEIFVAADIYTTPQQLVDAVNTALAGNASAVLNEDNTMSIISDEDVTITGTVALDAVSGLGIPALTQSLGSLDGANILDVDASNDIIRRLDSALTSISDLRSTFGAIQNRFESTITNLATSVENLSASRSRILDADFAAETAALTRAQILQQAGTAMLSQANAIPQNVLSLLQG